MYKSEEIFISETESLCPVCLRKLKAYKVSIDGNVYLKKACPEHGEYKVILWRGKPYYQDWNIETDNTPPLTVLTDKELGCPFDCGVCPQHKQQACCVLIEVTKRCNQNCAFCFANSGSDDQDPSLDEISEWFKYLISISEERPFNIQISGGEPTVRDDLPDIIKIGKELGLPYIQLNTNGKRLAEDENYVKKLSDAGLSSVFLQFDGVNDDVYEKLRGKRLLDVKLRAIENCEKFQLGTVLVPTLVPGINTDNIGDIIKFALEKLPTVRGIHFQPVSYFGKFPKAPGDSDRITLPEVMQKIEEQTNGKIKAVDLKPLQSGCALCSFKGSFVYLENGQISSISDGNKCSCQCSKDKAAIIKTRDFIKRKWELKKGVKASTKTRQYDFSAWDSYIKRIQDYGFSITCMAFQDVWNLDLQRLQKCSVNIFSQDNRKLIPFCAYNLTSSTGKALYRR